MGTFGFKNWIQVALLFVVASSYAQERPNVLFIVVDDLNDMIGSYGDTQVKTPHLDRLAERSLQFDLAMSSSPLCNPSRTAVLTGLPAYVTGIYENNHSFRDIPEFADWVTLPQYFRKHGYRALAGGKVFHKAAGKHSDPQSWDEIYHDKSGTAAPCDEQRWQHGMKGEFALDYYNKAIDWAALDTPKEETIDWQTADKAAKILSEESEQPLFLAVGIFRPHLPWYAPKEFFDMYPLESIQLPKTRAGDLEDVGPIGRKMAGGQAQSVIEKHGKWREAVRAYLANVSYADACVGHLLDALEKSPHADNTIVVLWGDHGFHLGEKEHWEKYTLWERANRTPLYISAPGVTKARSVSPRPVALIDLHSTLIELCGLPARDDIYGKSLVPLLKKPHRKWHPALMTHYPNNHAVRDDRYRYIRYADGFEELYDHRNDPHEFENIAGTPEAKAIIKHLRRELPKENAGWPDYERTLNQH
ncbi:sulfatase [Pelagicoccus sp. NFK12]|uniref:Sulfatase n=1 Tax=Pelagicoccus enzymogenes TaxID=2773457 RepID=A0A927FBC0_9BACT|nr:sulfatase [Pelagicoccus enzymogenes]MBD5780651.1 sulfatase [Pelagicoccus enzymogenes]